MEDTKDTNIERMTSFIKLEAQEKANEIKIKYFEEYNAEKAKIVRNETIEIERNYKNSEKELQIDFVTKISDIRNKFNILFLKKKEEKANEFIKKVKDCCKEKNLEKKLILQCFDSVDEKEIICYCFKKDRESVKSVGKERKMEIEIRELDEKFLGGIILESKDGKTKCDNSFRKRCEVLREKYFCEIAHNLFGK
ncbi:V-ATPase V1 sector subunit E [Gurleya vavrai]